MEYIFSQSGIFGKPKTLWRLDDERFKIENKSFHVVGPAGHDYLLKNYPLNRICIAELSEDSKDLWLFLTRGESKDEEDLIASVAAAAILMAGSTDHFDREIYMESFLLPICDQDPDSVLEHIKNHSSIDLYNSFYAVGKQETRMKCNVCGKVFCYTLSDLKDNLNGARSNLLSSVGQLAGIVTGNYGAAILSQQNKVQIQNYTRCPNCHSSDLAVIEDGNPSSEELWETQNASFSSADEIRKYKELLDSGIISQEEFEAKKNKLLDM